MIYLLGLIGALPTLYYVFFKKGNKTCKTPKRVLITGAASGLGKGAVEYLLEKGDTVVAADVGSEGLAELKKKYGELKETNDGTKPRLVTLFMDVTNTTQVKEGMDSVRNVYGDDECLDAVVNFAGIMRGGPLVEMEDSDYHMTININVIGTFNVNKYSFPLLRRRRKENLNFGPRIVNVGSEISVCRMATGFTGGYSASKFAIEAYSTSLRQEFMMLPDPVHVVVINPGAMETPMNVVAGNRGEELNNFLLEHKAFCPNTEWEHALIPIQKRAHSYIQKNMKPANLVSEAVYKAVHATTPQRRYTVNVSYEMRLASIIPQIILDYAIYFGVKFVATKKQKPE